MTVSALLAANVIAALHFTPSAGAAPDREFVTTESRKVRCIVSEDHVVCQGPIGGFEDGPVMNGAKANIVSTDAAGDFQRTAANMPATDEQDPRNDLVLIYDETFAINGWTILPSTSGTRFTDDETGHGMFVSVEKVTPF